MIRKDLITLRRKTANNYETLNEYYRNEMDFKKTQEIRNIMNKEKFKYQLLNAIIKEENNNDSNK